MALSHKSMRERVLRVFEMQHSDEPDWFIGVYTAEESDPPDADIMLRVDVGEFPVVLCSSEEEMRECLDEGINCLFLIISESYSDQRIRNKALHFFERERRIKKNFLVGRARTGRAR
jgi:hypothetical protein